MAIRIIGSILCLLALSCVCAHGQDKCKERGYLESPPVFIDSEIDIPLAGMGVDMPDPQKILPDTDFQNLYSNGFDLNGVNVQPSLNVKIDSVRLGALYGLSRDWATGLSIPFYRVRVNGSMKGFPSTTNVTGIGGIFAGVKKRFFCTQDGDSLVATMALQLPNGPSHANFDQHNTATDRYFANNPGRLPLSWQPSSGTFNGLLGLAYGHTKQRLSYVALLAGKLNSEDDENVQIGNTFVAAGAVTYGVARRLAFAFGLTLRVQADDSYPNAPAPGAEAFPTTATTTHGTTFYVDPSVRFLLTRNIAVGVGVRIPVVTPDNGLVPSTRLNLIFYPGF